MPATAGLAETLRRRSRIFSEAFFELELFPDFFVAYA